MCLILCLSSHKKISSTGVNLGVLITTLQLAQGT